MEGTGQEFEFDRGVIELAAGDRVLFRQNNRRLDVRNGDTGTVNEIAEDQQGRRQITVTLDNGKVATFDPARYQKVEYGYASTIHANQGTGAPNVIGSISKSDDARSAHVTFTRTESVLHVHTHLQRDEIIKRLTSDRALAPKDDALLFASIVAKTGGPDTPWAKAVKQAQAFDADPLRKRHEAVMAQRRDGLRKAIIGIMTEQPNLTPRERDRQLQAAAKRFALDTFVAWAAKERTALETEWEAKERVARPPHVVGLELLKIVDKVSLDTLARAAPLGDAWRMMYRETFGGEPPRGVELTQLITRSKTAQSLLERAMKVAGIKPGAGPEPPKRGLKHFIAWHSLVRKTLPDSATHEYLEGPKSLPKQAISATNVCREGCPHQGLHRTTQLSTYRTQVGLALLLRHHEIDLHGASEVRFSSFRLGRPDTNAPGC